MNAVFQLSISIVDELDLQAVVLVFDLAFYAKAQRVMWNNPLYTEKTVLRLGEFHTLMSFFSVLGKRFSESGLADILVDAEVVASSSIQGVMKNTLK